MVMTNIKKVYYQLEKKHIKTCIGKIPTMEPGDSKEVKIMFGWENSGI